MKKSTHYKYTILIIISFIYVNSSAKLIYLSSVGDNTKDGYSQTFNIEYLKITNI